MKRIALVFCILLFARLAYADPVLLFSDLINGPKTGWNQSATLGAVVTVWGFNLGTSRGSNYIRVYQGGGNTVDLTASGDYHEWGTAGPARSESHVGPVRRISFHLKSGAEKQH